jgi:sirohydrochlorin ferrochelatase
MIDGTLLLVGRHTDGSSRAIDAHAERLRDRGVAASVRGVRYDRTHAVDGDGTALSEASAHDDGDVFLLPAVVANTRGTRHAVRSIAASISAPVCVCDPIGRAPVVSRLLLERAEEAAEPSGDTALVLVGFDSESSPPESRETLEYHARRLRERSGYGDVGSCYLLRDPSVECAQYNVSERRIAVVPAFVSPGPAIEAEIRAKIRDDSDRVSYADPLGTHPRLTDAMHAAVTKRCVLEARDRDASPPTPPIRGSGGRVDADGGRIPD